MKKESFVLAEIAKRWSCSHSTVLSHVYSGELPATDISANPQRRSRYIVMREDLERFEAERATPPPERPAPKRRRVRVPAGEVIGFFSE
ncbi:MAG: hypothetical protein ACODAD_14470 [Planctomycetota bacterium]